MRKFRLVVVPLIVLAMLVVGILPASAGQPGTGTTYIFVQNADPANNAQVTAQFYGDDGSPSGSLSVAVLAPYVGYVMNLSSVSPRCPVHGEVLWW